MRDPSRDPDSDKYPDRTFFWGAWRTDEQIERKREWNRERNRRRRQNPLYAIVQDVKRTASRHLQRRRET